MLQSVAVEEKAIDTFTLGPRRDTEPFLNVDDPPPHHGLGHMAVNPTLAKQVILLAGPVVLGMLTQTAINILDTVMVGYLPVEQANPGQAAIGASLPLMWLVGGFLSALWVGTQAITARRAGEGNDLFAGRALTNSLVIAVVSSVTLSGAAFLATPWLFEQLYADPKVVQLGTEYLQWRYIGILAMVATFSYKSFFDGIGRTKVFMTAAIVMNVLNVVLNFALIFGYEALSIPALGVRGAALASVISAYVGLFIMVAVSFWPRFLTRYHYYRPTQVNAGVLREIARLSLPNGAATIVVMIGFVAFYWVVGQVNDQVAAAGNPVISAANQVLITAAMVGFMSAMAFGSAAATLVGQSLGAKRPYLAERYAWNAVKLWAYFLGAVGLVMAIFPRAVLGLITQDPAVIDAAQPALIIIALMHPVIAVAVIFAQTLYGVGCAKFVMMVELVLHLLVMSPGAYLFGYVLELGLVGVFLGPAIYSALLGVAVVTKFLKGDWKHIEL